MNINLVKKRRWLVSMALLSGSIALIAMVIKILMSYFWEANDFLAGFLSGISVVLFIYCVVTCYQILLDKFQQ